MENNKIADVPYIVHEGAMVRLERINRRLWILAIILIALLGLSNGAWIYYESQWETTTTDIEATQDGDVNIVGGGDVSYGSEGTR